MISVPGATEPCDRSHQSQSPELPSRHRILDSKLEPEYTLFPPRNHPHPTQQPLAMPTDDYPEVGEIERDVIANDRGEIEADVVDDSEAEDEDGESRR